MTAVLAAVLTALVAAELAAAVAAKPIAATVAAELASPSAAAKVPGDERSGVVGRASVRGGREGNDAGEQEDRGELHRVGAS